MQRVAPGIERVEPEAMPGQGVQPGLPPPIAGEQPGDVAVRMRRVPACTDLEHGHLGRVLAQPRQQVIQ